MSDAQNLGKKEQLEGIVAAALEEAVRMGATSAAADVSSDEGLNINVREGDADVIEHTNDRSFSIRVYIGKRMGRASSGDLKPDAIKRTVRAALDIAKYTSEDDCAGLPDPKRLCRDPQNLDLYHPWNLTTEEAIEACCRIEEAAFQTDDRIVNSDGINLNSNTGYFCLGNTVGFLFSYPYSNHSMYGCMIAENEDGMQRDYAYTANVIPSKLTDPAVLGREAAKRTVERLSPRSLTPRKCPVIFDSRSAGHLIRAFASAASGSALYKKASFLVDKLGEPVMNEDFSLFEDPFVPASYGSDPFDEEGVEGSRSFIVEGGSLQRYFLSSYTARKLGMETTGNAGGPYNLYLQCRPAAFEKTLPDLLKRMGRGLLITELTGDGINLITGDYSRGCSGFWVENGEIQFPVEGISVAGNLKNMYKGFSATSGDIYSEDAVFTGSILVDEMTIAGQGEG